MLFTVLFAFNARSNPYLAGTLVFIIISDENVNHIFSQIHVRVAYLFLISSRTLLRNDVNFCLSPFAKALSRFTINVLILPVINGLPLGGTLRYV